MSWRFSHLFLFFFFPPDRRLTWLQRDGTGLLEDRFLFFFFSGFWCPLFHPLYCCPTRWSCFYLTFHRFLWLRSIVTLLASCYKEISNYILLLNLMTSVTHWNLSTLLCPFTGACAPLDVLSTVCRLWGVMRFILVSFISGEGDGTPLQYSCLENPMDRGAW